MHAQRDALQSELDDLRKASKAAASERDEVKEV
jgi:hypothetical protein